MCKIPLDLVIEILIRLPPKSLTRFKCVSKQWSSLISCRYFSERVFTVTEQQEEEARLYMCLVDKDGQRLLLSMSRDKTCSVVVDQDLSIPGMGGFFLNVVRGLICFSVREKACIYNPSIRQCLTLPAIKSDMVAEQGQMKHHTGYYIGHDPVNDQYKLFCTIVISSEWLANLKSEHWVLVLEAGGSWKKVESYHPHAPFSLGRAVNGSVVHYIAWLDMHTCAVVSFDIRSEVLTTILVPEEAGNVALPAVMMKADLIEYGGKITVFDHSYLKKEGCVDLWVLEDAGEKEWSKQTLVLQPCQRHLVQDIDLIVKGTTEEGKVMLAPLDMRSRFYILCYDLQINDLRKVEIKGVPHLWFDKDCYFDLRVMDESESKSFVYLET